MVKSWDGKEGYAVIDSEYCLMRRTTCVWYASVFLNVWATCTGYLWPLAFITFFCTGAGRACFQLSDFLSPLPFFPEFYQRDGCWPLMLSCHDLPITGDVPVKALAANMEALRCLKTLHFHLVLQLLLTTDIQKIDCYSTGNCKAWFVHQTTRLHQ